MLRLALKRMARMDARDRLRVERPNRLRKVAQARDKKLSRTLCPLLRT